MIGMFILRTGTVVIVPLAIPLPFITYYFMHSATSGKSCLSGQAHYLPLETCVRLDQELDGDRADPSPLSPYAAYLGRSGRVGRSSGTIEWDGRV
jgi:hypothetical protein